MSKAPLSITLAQACAAGACFCSLRRMARDLGGVRKWGRDAPIPLVRVLGVLGLDDTVWCLLLLEEDDLLRRWAVECAERALPILDAALPGDQRPRQVLKVARAYAFGSASEDDLRDARDVVREVYRATVDAPPAVRSAVSAVWWSVRASAGDAVGSVDSAAGAIATVGAMDDSTAAFNAALDAERAWQRERLRQYLAGEVG